MDVTGGEVVEQHSATTKDREGSRFYGVLALGRGNYVERTSRSGDDYARADLCDETTTYRLEVTPDGGVWLGRIGKRWEAANASVPGEWETLWTVEDGEEID